MGMNFSNLIVPQQYSVNTFVVNQINMNTNFEIEVPGYNGYFYNIQENCVYTSKKGTPFHKGRKRLKIYSDKEGNGFVYMLRTRDNYRGKVYLYEIRSMIYQLFLNSNLTYNPYNPIIFPGIIYDG